MLPRSFGVDISSASSPVCALDLSTPYDGPLRRKRVRSRIFLGFRGTTHNSPARRNSRSFSRIPSGYAIAYTSKIVAPFFNIPSGTPDHHRSLFFEQILNTRGPIRTGKTEWRATHSEQSVSMARSNFAGPHSLS